MTRDEIVTMVPGREMDALVAEKVMGWKISLDPAEDGGEWWFEKVGDEWEETDYCPESFFPSKNIAAAWEVVGRMKELDWTKVEITNYEGKWSAGFAHVGGSYAQSFGIDASHAICKAALLTRTEEETT